MQRLIVSTPRTIFDESQFFNPTPIRSLLTRSFVSNQLEIDLYSTEDKYLALIDLPAGVKEDSLELTIKENSVSIKATKVITPPEGYAPIDQNRRSGSFYGRIVLDKAIDENGVIAEVVNQVLWISLPIAQATPPGKVSIKFIGKNEDSNLVHLLNDPQKAIEATETKETKETK
jgi:HSP20 family molecular chaperone IbpA